MRYQFILFIQNNFDLKLRHFDVGKFTSKWGNCLVESKLWTFRCEYRRADQIHSDAIELFGWVYLPIEFACLCSIISFVLTERTNRYWNGNVVVTFITVPKWIFILWMLFCKQTISGKYHIDTHTRIMAAKKTVLSTIRTVCVFYLCTMFKQMVEHSEVIVLFSFE